MVSARTLFGWRGDVGFQMNKMLHMLSLSPGIQLGPLERQLLDILWRRKTATVRELLDNRDTRLAYTTVMTTLDRLYKKEILDRAAEGKAFRYWPRCTREELEKAAAGESIRQLLAAGSESSLPLSYLVEAVSEHDVSLLDDLQQILERKRRELRAREKSKKEQR
jgi:predicted transcriptional regulator